MDRNFFFTQFHTHILLPLRLVGLHDEHDVQFPPQRASRSFGAPYSGLERVSHGFAAARHDQARLSYHPATRAQEARVGLRPLAETGQCGRGIWVEASNPIITLRDR